MAYDVTTMIVFAVLGTLGAVAHVLIDASSWDDVKKFSSFKTILIGMIVGVLYLFLYSDHNFPNSVMTFVAGYMGTDFIEGLIDKMKKKNGNGTQ